MDGLRVCVYLSSVYHPNERASASASLVANLQHNGQNKSGKSEKETKAATKILKRE